MAVEIFRIKWTKLEPFAKAQSQSASQEGGIYLICRLTGQTKRLHYVGMSKDFSKRFGTHRSNASHVIADINKLYVSFGLVTCFEKSRMISEITPSQLHQLESYLINTLNPIGNDDSTKKGYKGNPIIVFNEGLGGLSKTMSNCPDLVKLLKYYIR